MSCMLLYVVVGTHEVGLFVEIVVPRRPWTWQSTPFENASRARRTNCYSWSSQAKSLELRRRLRLIGVLSELTVRRASPVNMGSMTVSRL